MVNDTTTLNGALSELGETMATNITAKGVTASASDGLTTLAGKILQISGGGGGSTVLFEDSGVTGTANTNYVKSHTGVNASVSSTGTTVSSTTSADCYYIANVLLPNDWVAEFTIVAVNYYGGIAFLDSSKTKQWQVEYDLYTSPYGLKWYYGATEIWISNDSTMGNTIKLEKQGTSLSIYLNDTLISTKTITDITGYLGWKTHSNSRRSVTFKDFTITSVSTPTNCATYIAEIDSAIEYINGSGS